MVDEVPFRDVLRVTLLLDIEIEVHPVVGHIVHRIRHRRHLSHPVSTSTTDTDLRGTVRIRRWSHVQVYEYHLQRRPVGLCAHVKHDA